MKTIDWERPGGPPWQQMKVTHDIEAYRTGWRGAWDALKAAITGDPRLTVPAKLTFSVWLKAGDALTFPQVEFSQS